MAQLLSYESMRSIAKKRLPKGLFDYIDRGIGDEVSLRELRHSLDAVKIAPRVLRSHHNRDANCPIFNSTLRAPFVIAPTALAGLIHPDGEIALTRAATRVGVPVCLSTQSLTSISRLRAAVPDAELWMQLYLWQDLSLSSELIDRARQEGVKVITMTVDTPYGARKEWNIRNGFDVPFRLSARSFLDIALHPSWLIFTILWELVNNGLPHLGNYPDGLKPALIGSATDTRVNLRRDLSWEDVAWVRDCWNDALILKGIMTQEDAAQAAAIGIDGIVVSSHGGRNFDAAPPPIKVLPDIAASMSDRLTILADGGIRRGLDILRYKLAGAEAVMLGRLPLWALAAGGEQGVELALQTLRQEFIEALDFAGIS